MFLSIFKTSMTALIISIAKASAYGRSLVTYCSKESIFRMLV
jgi:hypothetical protein